MALVWKSEFNRYIRLQRNHKEMTVEKLAALLRSQTIEIEKIHSFLGREPSVVLDIGCGLGIYDLAISRYFRSQPLFCLVDKTTSREEESRVYYSYRERGAFYNNLELTHQFLSLNQVAEENIHIFPVTDNQEESNQILMRTLPPVDLAISIISCGFHYPVSTYMNLVADKLRTGGIFAFHCRNQAENVPVLESRFDICHPPPGQRKEGDLLICRKRE